MPHVHHQAASTSPVTSTLAAAAVGDGLWSLNLWDTWKQLFNFILAKIIRALIEKSQLPSFLSTSHVSGESVTETDLLLVYTVAIPDEWPTEGANGWILSLVGWVSRDEVSYHMPALADYRGWGTMRTAASCTRGIAAVWRCVSIFMQCQLQHSLCGLYCCDFGHYTMEIHASISKGCSKDTVLANGCTLLRIRAYMFCCFFRIIFAWLLLNLCPCSLQFVFPFVTSHSWTAGIISWAQFFIM